MNPKQIKIEAEREIGAAQSMRELDQLFKKYLGERGEIAHFFSSLKSLPKRERKKMGELANRVKKEIISAIEIKKVKFQVPPKHPLLQRKGTTGQASSKFQEFDITAPGKKQPVGHLHPLTLVRRKCEEIFQQIGFSVVEGPEIETEWYNFDALNIPRDHPARDLWDTLWLQNSQKILNPKSEILNKYKSNPTGSPELRSVQQNSKSQKLLLRTHTSPVQIRYMEKHQPPFRIIAPGRVFRHEATDASHEVQFYQVEGLMVGRDVSVANFRAIAKEFFGRFFDKEIKIRLRPGFFSFTEPSFEIDISCVNCNGKGCGACKKTGWVETVGAGMVHPNVLKAGGLIPSSRGGDWQGFAFGMGMDRLAMLKYKINDIRLFYSGDLRFLQQF